MSRALTVNEKQKSEKPACKPNPIVQRNGVIEAGHTGEAGGDKLLSSFIISKMPMLEEEAVDLC